MRIQCSDLILKNTSVRENRKQEILDGIRQNLSYKQIACNIGIRRRELIRDIKTMQRIKDPELKMAQSVAEAKLDEAKKVASKKRDKQFHDFMGMTPSEKSFQNMVYFYKSELTNILDSDDQIAAIRELPTSVRKTLTRNKILIKYGQTHVSKLACEQLVKVEK